MTQRNDYEVLSALVDDELRGADLEAAIDQLLDSPELREKWAGFHALGDSLREPSGISCANLADRVLAELPAKVVSIKPRPTSPKWMRPAFGVALAASVAAMAVFGLRLTTQATGGSSPPAIASAAQASTKLRWDVRRPEVEAKLNRYLVNHSEFMSRGMYGMHPYARIVGYQSKR